MKWIFGDIISHIFEMKDAKKMSTRTVNLNETKAKCAFRTLNKVTVHARTRWNENNVAYRLELED